MNDNLRGFLFANKYAITHKIPLTAGPASAIQNPACGAKLVPLHATYAGTKKRNGDFASFKITAKSKNV